MCPIPHPIKMHGIKIPEGAAVPEDRQVNINHIVENIKALENRISLWSDINERMVFYCDSKIKVASLSNLPSGHKNVLVGMSF